MLGLSDGNCKLPSSFAEPVTYEIDPRHTFPSFEADHQGGISVWRGKIESSSGTIVIDQEAQTGTVNVTMDMDTINFGLDDMTNHAKAEDILDVAQFPTASYSGTLTNFTKDGEPTAVEGEFTLHGVTQPLDLQIADIQARDVHLIEKKLERMLLVTQILCSEKRRAAA